MPWFWILLAIIVAEVVVIVTEETNLFPPAAAPFKDLVMQSASYSGVPWQLMAAQIGQESAWDPNAYNASSGATGIAQFIASTAADLGVDPTDPASAIPGMANYMRSLYDQLSAAGYAQWSYALAAYDWGIGHVLNALNRGTPPDQWPPETRDYVTRITSKYGIDQTTAAAFA